MNEQRGSLNKLVDHGFLPYLWTKLLMMMSTTLIDIIDDKDFDYNIQNVAKTIVKKYSKKGLSGSDWMRLEISGWCDVWSSLRC